MVHIFAILVALFAAGPVWAQSGYPAAPVKLVYGYAPGGGGDIVARLLAQKLSLQMNGSVVVENKAGASGHIANEFVARSKPDGYTLIFNDAGVSTGPALGEKLGYDISRDLIPVSLVAVSPHALFVNPKVPAGTTAEFIAYLRANPGKLHYASGGTGSNSHLSPLLFLQINGLSSVHVPYKGSAPMMIDVVSGRVQWGMSGMTAVLPFAKENRISVLGFGGRKRSPLLPDVPTLAETVMPGFEVGTWNGVMVPVQTPPAIVKRLNSEILKALQDSEVRARMEQQGSEPQGTAPEEYAAFIRREAERWTTVIKAAGIKVE